MIQGDETILHLSQWFQQKVEEDLHVSLSNQQITQFAQYLDQLLETNRQINLTAITEPFEVYGKHFYDSLTPATIVSIQQIRTVMDIGTGAGFPGIPLKIAFPHLQVVLLDSLKKRVHFLNQLIRKLGLKGIQCLHGRAEEWGRHKDYREQFDLVTARAVAKLNVLAEYCLPFVKVGGTFVAMKGSEVEEELSQAERAFTLLGNATYQQKHLLLPNQLGKRVLIRVDKNQSTPKSYPRRAGIPKKQPL